MEKEIIDAFRRNSEVGDIIYNEGYEALTYVRNKYDPAFIIYRDNSYRFTISIDLIGYSYDIQCSDLDICVKNVLECSNNLMDWRIASNIRGYLSEDFYSYAIDSRLVNVDDSLYSTYKATYRLPQDYYMSIVVKPFKDKILATINKGKKKSRIEFSSIGKMSNFIYEFCSMIKNPETYLETIRTQEELENFIKILL